jgi:hypothetical protein
MNSDERLICSAAQALIGTLTGVQVALMGDEAELDLPLLILMAKLKDEDSGTNLAEQYELTAATRWIFGAEPAAGADVLLEQISNTLCPRGETTMGSPPSAVTTYFDYYRIEKQTGSTFTQGPAGDLGERSRERGRTFLVLARLRTY